MIAALTGALGTAHLDLAEDVVQEALLKALQTWPYHGVPDNPEGWLYRVARNRAIDEIRRSRTARRRLGDGARDVLPAPPPPSDIGSRSGIASRFDDDELTMMFLACHPALTRTMRVTLTLKVVAGFSTDEIAAAFLADRRAVQQRLVRAKRILRERDVPFAMPAETELPRRLGSVLRVIYLVFNEGYGASSGSALVRGELCGEAVRLGLALAGHPATDRPEVHALLAIMYLQASRIPARTDRAGAPILLEDQDRGLWDRRAIAAGLSHLDRAGAGDRLTSYHLEAAIAACHAAAPDFASTDWTRVLELYEELSRLRPSSVIKLNRSVAVAMVHGPEAGLRALDELLEDRAMQRYHLYSAVRGRLLERAGRTREAATAYRSALDLVRTAPERKFLGARLDAMENERTGDR